jgi:hypothetical protein
MGVAYPKKPKASPDRHRTFHAQRFRVLDVVPFEEEDESPFVGLLHVEHAYLISGERRTLDRIRRGRQPSRLSCAHRRS